MDRPLFDIGLQLERTSLSWRRTSLSITIASLVIARLATPQPSVVTLVFAFVGLAIAATLFGLSHRRYRVAHVKLIEASSDRVALGGAWLLVSVAIFVSAISIGGLVYIILRSIYPAVP